MLVSKPVLKVRTVSGFQRLKLQYEEPLSNFAFKLNVRRYIAAHSAYFRAMFTSGVGAGREVWRCRLTPGSPQVDPRLTPG